MHSLEIKKKFIQFFQERDHKEAVNASLIPENDPTVLFTTAGMHPLVPFLLGEPHPQGKRLVNVQRCLRTDDIEEVGDTTHNTFFEMTGYWSLGDYFKKEAIQMTFEFLTDKRIMDLDPERLYVTVFEGDKDAPLDEESIETWKNIFKEHGIEAEVWNGKDFTQKNLRIFPLNKKENWWGPAGQTGPCGPCSETFYWRGKEKPDFKKYVPWDTSNMFIEICNDVFMAYNKNEDGTYTPLKQKNVDFGKGFERLCLVKQFKEEDGTIPYKYTIFNTDLFDTPAAYIRSLIEDESKESTKEENEKASEITEFDITLTDLKDTDQAVQAFRVILDHMRAATFLLGDGVEPSNKDQGYILRRLIRRAIRHARLIGINTNFTKDMAELYIEKYKVQYPFLEEKHDEILNKLEKEEINFEGVIKRGAKELDKLTATLPAGRQGGEQLAGKHLFTLYETHGFPIEMALDHLGIFDDKEREKIEREFDSHKEKHQKLSRKGAEQKFKGGLADHSDATKRYHTATHLLLRALQMVLGPDIHQRGSNITQERLRFDFSHPEKVTSEELKKVEDIVNDTISKGLKVVRKEMKKDEAIKIGAEHEFDKNYPDEVSVYFIQDEKGKEVFSKEFCGGPHVESLNELAKAGTFKITKEESSGAGIRRIKAIMQKS